MKQLKTKDIPKLRKHLLKKQKYICPICNKKIKKEDAVLDHHHKKKIGGTGKIRAVLCRTCNVFIAKIENNCKRYKITNEELPFVLENVKKYLTKTQLPYIHPSEAPQKKVLKKTSYNKLQKAYTGSAKFPLYRTKGNRNIQILTKQLEKLFIKYGIEPEFYK